MPKYTDAQIDELLKKNEEFKNKIADLSKPTGPLVSGAFDLASLVKGLSNPIDKFISVMESNVSPAKIADDFAKSYTEMEKAVQGLAISFGGSRDMAVTIKKTIDLATPSVMALGGTMTDVINIQKGVTDALQKQVILDKQSYADLYAASSLVSDGRKADAATTAKMITQFKDLGYSIYDISKQIGGVVNMSRDMGVATSAVYGQLSENVGKLNLYNFDNGIKGMAKMAAEAASLRLNMKDTFDFAEKVFKPEQALEMASNMQRLGISVTNLLDPFKMMDMAQNRPEELQKSLMQAAKEFVGFSEAQGRFVVTDQRRLREFADAIGKSASEVAQMGINFADMERKMQRIDFGKDIVGEDDKKFFAGLAELKDGKYVVNVTTNGEPALKELHELTQAERDQLKKEQADKEKSPAQLQLESLHSLQRIEYGISAMAGLTGRHLAASETADKVIGLPEKYGMSLYKAAQEQVGVKDVKGTLDITGFAGRLDKMGDTIIGTVKDILEDPEKGLNNALSSLSTQIFSTISNISNSDEYLTNLMNRSTEIYKENYKEKGEEDLDYLKDIYEPFKEKLIGLFSMINTGGANATGGSTTNSQVKPVQGGEATQPATNQLNQTTPTNPQTNTAGAQNNTSQSNVNINGITDNAATVFFNSMFNAVKLYFDEIRSSPAISVSLWGDKLGLVDSVKEGTNEASENSKQLLSLTKENKPHKTPITIKTPKETEKKEEIKTTEKTTEKTTDTETNIMNIIREFKERTPLTELLGKMTPTNVFNNFKNIFEQMTEQKFGGKSEEVTNTENIINNVNNIMDALNKVGQTTNISETTNKLGEVDFTKFMDIGLDFEKMIDPFKLIMDEFMKAGTEETKEPTSTELVSFEKNITLPTNLKEVVEKMTTIEKPKEEMMGGIGKIEMPTYLKEVVEKMTTVEKSGEEMVGNLNKLTLPTNLREVVEKMTTVEKSKEDMIGGIPKLTIPNYLNTTNNLTEMGDKKEENNTFTSNFISKFGSTFSNINRMAETTTPILKTIPSSTLATAPNMPRAMEASDFRNLSGVIKEGGKVEHGGEVKLGGGELNINLNTNNSKALEDLAFELGNDRSKISQLILQTVEKQIRDRNSMFGTGKNQTTPNFSI